MYELCTAHRGRDGRVRQVSVPCLSWSNQTDLYEIGPEKSNIWGYPSAPLQLFAALTLSIPSPRSKSNTRHLPWTLRTKKWRCSRPPANSVSPSSHIRPSDGDFSLDSTSPPTTLRKEISGVVSRGRLVARRARSWTDYECRYSKENFPNILKIADGLKQIGEKHNATAGQVALAWVLAQGEDIIPIPGTEKIKVCPLLDNCAGT